MIGGKMGVIISRNGPFNYSNRYFLVVYVQYTVVFFCITILRAKQFITGVSLHDILNKIFYFILILLPQGYVPFSTLNCLHYQLLLHVMILQCIRIIVRDAADSNPEPLPLRSGALYCTKEPPTFNIQQLGEHTILRYCFFF